MAPFVKAFFKLKIRYLIYKVSDLNIFKKSWDFEDHFWKLHRNQSFLL